MNFGFAWPLGLVALAAVLVPIVVHLARREETRIEPFAALRFIRAVAKPRARIRLDEWWLLAVRIALVVVLALWLARPFGPERVGDVGYVAVSPDVPLDRARAAAGSGALAFHWLAPGFPRAEHAASRSTASVSSLLRELDAALPPGQAVTVVVPAVVGPLDAGRIELKREVRWLPVDVTVPAPAVDAKPRVLALRHDAADAARYVRAAVAGWNAGEGADWRLDEAALDAPIASGSTAAVVIGDALPGSAVAYAEAGGRVVHVPSANARPAGERRAGRGIVLTVDAPFVPDQFPSLLEASFPSTLRGWVDPPARPDRARAELVKPTVARAADDVPPRTQSLVDLLAWIALGLFAIERWLATRRARFVS